jgi:hypothetical protein
MNSIKFSSSIADHFLRLTRIVWLVSLVLILVLDNQGIF